MFSNEEEQLLQILDQYLQEHEAGLRPDLDSFIARFPHLENRLRECLPGLEAMEAFTHSVENSDGEAGVVPQFSDYKILGELGRGGMGIVYRAHQISLDRPIALKVLPMAAVFDEKNLQRFKNEANATARLNHDHIINVYSISCENGVHYYSMQLIEGRSLAEVIVDLRDGNDEHSANDITERWEYLPTIRIDSANGAARQDSNYKAESTQVTNGKVETEKNGKASGLSEYNSHGDNNYIRAVVKIGSQIADALFHAHEMGIVHRDIKPSNLLMDATGKVCVSDFGLARMQHEVELTRTGDIMGTLRYMSPEQANGQNDLVDHRTDVYSLGATLYELLTLQPVVSGNGKKDILKQLLEDNIIPPSKLNRWVPPDLDTILLKSLAAQRENRYASAAEFAEDLNRFLNHQPILARRPTVAQRCRKWLTRNRWFAATGATFLLLLLSGSVVSSILIYQQNEKLRTSESTLTLQNEQLQEALIRANAAETKVENLPAFFENLGKKYLEQERFIDAAKMFDAKLALDSDSDTSKYYKALSSAMIGDNATAETLFDQLIASETVWTKPAQFYFGWMLFNQDRLDESRKQIEQSLKSLVSSKSQPQNGQALPLTEARIASQLLILINYLLADREQMELRYENLDAESEWPYLDGDRLCVDSLYQMSRRKPVQASLSFEKALRWYTYRINGRSKLEDDFSKALINCCSTGLNIDFDANRKQDWANLKNKRLESTQLTNSSAVIGTKRKASIQSPMNRESWGTHWTPFTSDQKRNGVQMFWYAKPEERLSILFNKPDDQQFQSGAHRMTCYLTHSNDFGIIQFWLNGQKIGPEIDLFDPAPTEGRAHAAQFGETEIGIVQLQDGMNRLEIEVVGKNNRSIAYNVGVDFVDLWPVDFVPGQQ